MKSFGVFGVKHEQVELGHNERERHSLDGIEALKRSIILTGGNVNPGIVEFLGNEKTREGLANVIANNGHIKQFKLLAGYRRFQASREAGIPIYWANVYQVDNERQRIEIQIIENTTKRKIPSQELGQGLVQLYKYIVAGCKGIREDSELHEFNKKEGQDFKLLRQTLPFKVFTGSAHVSAKTFSRARLYDNLVPYMHLLVKNRKAKYSTILEFGRLEKKEQLPKYNEFFASHNGKSTRELAQKYVRNYINRHRPVGALQLTPIVARNTDPTNGINSKLWTLDKLLKNILCVAEADPSMIKQGSILFEASLEEILYDICHRLDSLQSLYAGKESYETAMQSYQQQQRRRSLLARMLSGESQGKIGDKIITQIELNKMTFKQAVPIENIMANRYQPRKTFEDETLRELAETIKVYGILQTIMVRPKGHWYEIVFGERRYRSAQLAGLKDIDVLICPMDDLSAHVIQREEDIFEIVDPRDRSIKLGMLYEETRQGKDYSMEEFAAKYSKIHHMKTSQVIYALKWASLDERTRTLLNHSNRPYSIGLAISNITDKEFQYPYSVRAVLLNTTVNKLKATINEDSQPFLPFGDYDFHKERMRAIKLGAIEQVAMYTKVLGDERVSQLNKVDYFAPLCGLMESNKEIKNRILIN